MCGRYTLTDPARLRSAFPRFAFEEFSEYRLPRFNIAPTQCVLGVRNDGRDAITPMRWGLLLPQSGDSATGHINARSETLASKPSFRDAFRRRRCVLFADGFYEWHGKKPVRFTLKGDRPFAFAGLWSPSRDARATCAIVTCPPNELVAKVHDRMPVILARDAIAPWLSPEELPSEVAAAFLRPYDAWMMQARDASMRLNDARYDAADVLLDDDPMQALGLT